MHMYRQILGHVLEHIVCSLTFWLVGWSVGWLCQNTSELLPTFALRAYFNLCHALWLKAAWGKEVLSTLLRWLWDLCRCDSTGFLASHGSGGFGTLQWTWQKETMTLQEGLGFPGQRSSTVNQLCGKNGAGTFRRTWACLRTPCLLWSRMLKAEIHPSQMLIYRLLWTQVMWTTSYYVSCQLFKKDVLLVGKFDHWLS